MQSPIVVVLANRSKKMSDDKGDLYGAKEEAKEAQMSDKEKLLEQDEEEQEGVRPKDLEEAAMQEDGEEDIAPLTGHLSDYEKERMMSEKPKSLGSYAMRAALMKAKIKKA